MSKTNPDIFDNNGEKSTPEFTSRPSLEEEEGDIYDARSVREFAESHGVSVDELETFVKRESPRWDYETKTQRRIAPDRIDTEVKFNISSESQSPDIENIDISNRYQKITAEEIQSLGRIASTAATALMITGLYAVYAGVIHPLTGGVGTVILLSVAVFSFFIQHFISENE